MDAAHRPSDTDSYLPRLNQLLPLPNVSNLPAARQVLGSPYGIISLGDKFAPCRQGNYITGIFHLWRASGSFLQEFAYIPGMGLLFLSTGP